MWTDLLIDNKAVKAIYGNYNEPDLSDVEMQKISIGQYDLDLELSGFNLPNPLPKRWAERGWTNGCCALLFYNKEETSIYRRANLNICQYKHMSIHIKGEPNGKKSVIITDQHGNCYLEIEADFVSINKIGGC